jgi:hypothetical protein
MPDIDLHAALAGQREAIVNKIEEMALAILTDPEADDAGAPIAAAFLRQAAEVARWTVYDPTEASRG